MSEALAAILAATRVEIAQLRSQRRDARSWSERRLTIDVEAKLRRAVGAPLRLIAEIKKRSPSAGALSTALSVDERARRYEAGGAAMISVLVDRAHFDGGYEDLASAREAVAVPLLSKGFALDEVQLDAARAAGADAVLLIARILDDARLLALLAHARALDLTPVVEVIDEAELARALQADARVIGVNARDLSTLEMDVARAARVLEAVPRELVALHFSGVKGPEEVTRFAARGLEPSQRAIEGVLVGEALMRLDDPTALLAAMLEAASAH